MFFIDLIIWGLVRLFSQAPMKDDSDVTTFIYMNDDGDLQNMWKADTENSKESDDNTHDSDFDIN